MAIYFMTALITAICSEISVKNKNKIVRRFSIILVIGIPSILYAFRYGIGTDYFRYVLAFQRLQVIGFDSRYEWGYVLINLIVGKLNGNVQVVFLLTSIIMMTFIYCAVRYYAKTLSVGIAMFSYMMMYYQMSYNAVRQSVAMAICLYSIKYIHDRKLLKFSFLVLLASGFHTTALLLFPFYFFYKILGEKNKKGVRFLFYMIMSIGVLNIGNILRPMFNRIPSLNYYSSYLDSSTSDFSIGLFSRFIPFLLMGLYLYDHTWKRDEKFILIISLYSIGLILKLTGLVGAQYINRVSLSFEVTLVLLIAYCVKSFNVRREYFASIILLFYVVINWWYIYIYSGSHGTVPYKSIFGL